MPKLPPEFAVETEEHREWNTKRLFYRGNLLRMYRRVPKVIRFKSPMVNDYNQFLCGGFGAGDDDARIGRQLLAGRKPFGQLGFWSGEVDAARARFESAGLLTAVDRRISSDTWTGLLVCHDMRVGGIGPIEDLFTDYQYALPDHADWFTEMLAAADRPLKSFFKAWDAPEISGWLAGLILGYPVENTISIYRSGFFT